MFFERLISAFQNIVSTVKNTVTVSNKIRKGIARHALHPSGKEAKYRGGDIFDKYDLLDVLPCLYCLILFTRRRDEISLRNGTPPGMK